MSLELWSFGNILSLFNMENGTIWWALILAVAIVALLVVFGGKVFGKITTKTVVAIGIGAALYGALSMISIPIGPNTSFRIAVAILPIIGAIFGPVAGFLVGFIGHALNDALLYGGVWWSWVFLSAFLGLFSGLITKNKSFDVLRGKITGKDIGMMYLWTLVGAVVGSIVAYAGDVVLYGEPANKVWLQIILANGANLIPLFVVGIPVVILIAKMRSRDQNLEIEE